ncbi:hypothetical protein V1264_015512 [Littorina saxatilis]
MADDEDDSLNEIAHALIVTNLDIGFFDDDSRKEEFEAAFRSYDSDASFNYLKSFRRARVNFTSTESTVSARLKYHDTELCGQIIKCYFAQLPMLMSNDNLLPPKQEKLFLISPPSSPPVGWEQVPESEPVLNFELIDALARLTPDREQSQNGGEIHEVHPPSQTMPAIVVHLCEDPEGFSERPMVLQTRRPERM